MRTERKMHRQEKEVEDHPARAQSVRGNLEKGPNTGEEECKGRG